MEPSRAEVPLVIAGRVGGLAQGRRGRRRNEYSKPGLRSHARDQYRDSFIVLDDENRGRYRSRVRLVRRVVEYRPVAN